MVTLVSFDIDGTLEVGDPPGIVSVALVKTAQRLGYLVGTARIGRSVIRKSLWERLQITVDFTVLKHELGERQGAFRGGGVLPHRRHGRRRPLCDPRRLQVPKADVTGRQALARRALQRPSRPDSDMITDASGAPLGADRRARRLTALAVAMGIAASPSRRSCR